MIFLTFPSILIPLLWFLLLKRLMILSSIGSVKMENIKYFYCLLKRVREFKAFYWDNLNLKQKYYFGNKYDREGILST